MESDSYYMGLALEAAREGLAAGEVPVGAVLVDEAGEVLARAFNRPIGLSDPTAHAEILVLRAGARLRGNYRLPGLSLYVTIEPCIMCLGAMLAARVRRVVFGAPDPKGGACVSLLPAARGCPPQPPPGSDGRDPGSRVPGAGAGVFSRPGGEGRQQFARPVMVARKGRTPARLTPEQPRTEILKYRRSAGGVPKRP